MTRASSVFKAMLSPRFREGTQLSSSGAVEIACPEDDAEAMATICYIVDHRASKASRARVCSELLQVARLSDKYDLNEVMRPHAQGWLTEKLKLINAAPSTGDRLDVGKAQTEIDERREWLLAAAYYFDLQTTFEELGREIVCKGVGVSPSSTILFGLAPAIDEDLLHVSGESQP